MRDDDRVWIGHFFFDVELDGAATEVDGVWNVFILPLIFIPNIDDYCLIVLQFGRRFFR